MGQNIMFKNLKVCARVCGSRRPYQHRQKALKIDSMKYNAVKNIMLCVSCLNRTAGTVECHDMARILSNTNVPKVWKIQGYMEQKF